MDFVRPSPFPGFMRGFVTVVRLLSRSFNHVFYNNWKVIGR